MQVDRLCQQWRINKEIGNDIVKLALYDVVLYIDDSGSMRFEENGERIKDLQLILERVATAATLFDDDGIDLRFMNDQPPEHLVSHIKTEQQIQQLISGHKFGGLTPMGTELRKKVIDGIFLRSLRSGQMRKPLLIISITDGQPAGEPTTAVFDTVRYAVSEAGRSQYGPGAVAFQFAQVGNDEKAREFLGKLDDDPEVGQLVDCTSNFENESAEMARANPPVDLTPDLWVSSYSSLRYRNSSNFKPPDPEADSRRNRLLVRHQGREVKSSSWWPSRRSSWLWCTPTARWLRRPIPSSSGRTTTRPVRSAGWIRPTGWLWSTRWLWRPAGWIWRSAGWISSASSELRKCSSPASPLLSLDLGFLN